MNFCVLKYYKKNRYMVIAYEEHDNDDTFCVIADCDTYEEAKKLKEKLEIDNFSF